MDTLVVSLTTMVKLGLVHVSLDTVYIDTVFFHSLRLDNCEAIVLTDTVQQAIQLTPSSWLSNPLAVWLAFGVTVLSSFFVGFFLAALLASGKDN